MSLWDFVMRRKAFFLPLLIAFIMGGFLGGRVLSDTELIVNDDNSETKPTVEDYDYQAYPETIHVVIANPEDATTWQNESSAPSANIPADNSGELNDQIAQNNTERPEQIDIPHTGSSDHSLIEQIIAEHFNSIASTYLSSLEKQTIAKHFSAWQSIVLNVSLILAVGVLAIILARIRFLRQKPHKN